MMDWLRMVTIGISIGLAALSVMPFKSAKTDAHTPKPVSTEVRTIRGEASWGPFRGHIVTRYKGHMVKACGPLACSTWTRSYGYGPAKWTGRIADLDVHVFEHICGPRSRGVCNIKLFVD